MVRSMLLGTLKQGMKLWIVASDRVQATVAELREGAEDMTVEARAEYERSEEAPARPAAEPEVAAAPATPVPETSSAEVASTDTAAGPHPGAAGADVGPAAGGPVHPG